jgi:predicted nucleic acid-binding protein
LTIVVDAAPLVALADARDPLHGAVLDTLRRERGELVVPAPVTAEIDYLIRTRGGQTGARRFLHDVAEGRFKVEGLTREEHGLALELDLRYSDLNPGLADLSVVVLAHRFRTERLLTFDERDFRAMRPLTGDHFQLLPRDA